MNNAALKQENNNQTVVNSPTSIQGYSPDIFTKIYQEDINLVHWQRELPETLTTAVEDFLQQQKTSAKMLAVTPENTSEVLRETFGDTPYVKTLGEDIALLVDMFCCLFELKEAGLRLTILERAMCPRFHVDRIPCRLVTTYHGAATQWLEHNVVNQEKLGAGNQGMPDETSGLIKNINDIKQLSTGDVALLKGEYWHNNEGAGLVHRSPAVAQGDRRLMLTLDFLF